MPWTEQRVQSHDRRKRAGRSEQAAAFVENGHGEWYTALAPFARAGPVVQGPALQMLENSSRLPLKSRMKKRSPLRCPLTMLVALAGSGMPAWSSMTSEQAAASPLVANAFSRSMTSARRSNGRTKHGWPRVRCRVSSGARVCSSETWIWPPAVARARGARSGPESGRSSSSSKHQLPLSSGQPAYESRTCWPLLPKENHRSDVSMPFGTGSFAVEGIWPGQLVGRALDRRPTADYTHTGRGSRHRTCRP
jgi:hypothetical protein